MVELQNISPAEIEAESFRIIEAEFKDQTGRDVADYTEGEFKVLQRVIHATGDFTLADSIVFQHDPISAALVAIRQGGDIVTDVNMVASGISRPILSAFGGKVVCRMAEAETAAMASELGITRAEATMRRSIDERIAAIAIGNAPTALVATLKLIES
jgi:precorrin-8X/cobalt-precorrin-8 methylmutase